MADGVRELRLVVTAPDYDAALRFYRDVLEVGRRVAGPVRVALQVDDAAATTDRLVAGGATLVAPPVETPWGSLNSRLEAPAGLQLTLFQELRPEV